MNSLKQIIDYFSENFFKLKVIHHRHAVGFLNNSPYFENKIIKLSQDMAVIQINDHINHLGSTINKIPFYDKQQIVEIIIPKYIKWSSKIKELKTYIEINYNNLPEYILYVDGTDVLIINDIPDPEYILDFYNCKILFACEPLFVHTGYVLNIPNYFDNLYNNIKNNLIKLNHEKYKIESERSLNAGIILGRKDYLLNLLRESYELMMDDPKKLYPYGCLDDQLLFKFFINKYFNDISSDVYNIFFLYAYPKSIECDENNWEHWEYFKKKYICLYKPNYLI